jgi:hypothetical protein
MRTGYWANCERQRKAVSASTTEPQDHRDDENGGQDSHPPLGVEVKAGAFESQLMIGHDRALHFKKLEALGGWI